MRLFFNWEQEDVETILKDHLYDFVCLQTAHWRGVQTGASFLETLDDCDLHTTATYVDEDPSETEYDVFISIC